MKKLIFLILIPIISFGQTYEDIVSINSKEQFIRIGIENNYEIDFNTDERVIMILQPSGDGASAVFKGRAKAEFIKNDKGLAALFFFNQDSVQEKSKYDEIFSFIKKNHKFKEIFEGNNNGEAASVYILDEKTDVAFFIDDGWYVVAILARNFGEINPLVGTWEGDMNDAKSDSVYAFVVLKSDNTGNLKIPTSENTYKLEIFNWSSTSTTLKLSYIDDFNEVYNTEFIDYEFYDNNTLVVTDNQGVISFFYRSE